MKSKIELGREIRDDVFGGNPHAQAAWTREFCELLLHKLELYDDPDFAPFVEMNEAVKAKLGKNVQSAE